jgi:hypothetical protein
VLSEVVRRGLGGVAGDARGHVRVWRRTAGDGCSSDATGDCSGVMQRASTGAGAGRRLGHAARRLRHAATRDGDSGTRHSESTDGG